MTLSLPKAAIGALGFELLLLFVLAITLAHQVRQAPAVPAVQMMLLPTPPLAVNKPVPPTVQPKTPVVPTPVKPPPVVPKPVHHAPPPKVVHHRPAVKPAKPVPRHVVRHVVMHKPVHHPRKVAVAHPLPVHRMAPIPVKQVAPAKPTPPAKPTVSNAYRSEVRHAIQSAATYPYAAKISQITGKARVSFMYEAGHVLDAHIIVSSGVAMLDQAALSAVKDATIPSPPNNLIGDELNFKVWVRFYLGRT